jgi:adenine-specific DNA-methyltransferase
VPTLNWIGKEKVISHHRDVPFKILEHKYGFTENGESKKETHSGNKIIHGDNLEALKSLLPEYEGKVKCISIDPPYNTGTEHWRYNDNVSHPKILKWFKEVVGKEGDDLSRHDKWLCMMYPRLQLLHKLLASDGLIFINIDDNEYHNLLYLLNEIFGIRNKLSTLVWDLGSGTSAGHFTRAHEYVVVYAKNKSLVANFEGGVGFIDDRAVKKIGYKNPASDFTFKSGIRFDAEDGFELKGIWGDNETIELIDGRMVSENGKLKYDVTLRAGYTQKKQMKSWFDGLKTLDSKGQEVVEFYFRKNGKIYCRKRRERINPPSVIRGLSSKTGSAELTKILGKNEFDFPKPSDLIKFFIELSTEENDIVLDSFAGSGSTAHAVLKLNESEPRKFILIQMNEYDGEGNEINICEDITAKRIKKVILGYDDISGTGGSFDFYELGKPLFVGDNNEYLNEEVETEKIREYIWYSETRTAYEKPDVKKDTSYFLGKKEETAYYFIYEKKELTTLDYDSLSEIKNKSGQYVIYADNCLLPNDFMMKNNIVFKKIPRDISRF